MSSDSENSDSDCEYMIFELQGILQRDFLQRSNGDCQILGLNTSAPLLKIRNATFQGGYRHTVGTDLIFSSSKDEEVEYVAKSFKRVTFTQVAVDKRQNDSSAKNDDKNDEAIELQTVNTEIDHEVNQ